MRPRNSISIILQYFIKSHLTSLCKNNFFRNIVITKDKIVLWFLHPFNEFVLIQICSNSFESYSMQCLSGFGKGGGNDIPIYVRRKTITPTISPRVHAKYQNLEKNRVYRPNFGVKRPYTRFKISLYPLFLKTLAVIHLFNVKVVICQLYFTWNNLLKTGM